MENDITNTTSATPSTPVENHSIGKYLKKCREDKNLSIKQISQQTKINSTQLELLEKDDLTKLPNMAYVIGYVKSYAKTLSLNLETCLSYLEETYKKILPPPATPVEDIPASRASIKITYVVVSVIIAVIVVLVMVNHRPSP
ncbi:MAG: helix-turn-helix transcriptional regulator, partial [Pseudomonadota bacterium]